MPNDGRGGRGSGVGVARAGPLGVGLAPVDASNGVATASKDAAEEADAVWLIELKSLGVVAPQAVTTNASPIAAAASRTAGLRRDRTWILR